jgi:subtilase family serine protease
VVVSSGRVSATGAILVTPEGGADIAITSWPSILLRSPGESVTIKIEAENIGAATASLALNLMIS